MKNPGYDRITAVRIEADPTIKGRPWSAYQATIKADAVFRAAVVAQFGAGAAGTMRYRYELHNATTSAAREKYRAELAAMPGFAEGR